MLAETRYFQTNTGRIPTRSGWLDASFCRVVTWIFVNIFSYFTGQLHVGHVSCATYQHVIQSNQKQSFGAGTLAFWCFVCSVLLGSIFVSSFEPYLAGHFARNLIRRQNFFASHFDLSTFWERSLKIVIRNPKNYESFNQFPWRQQSVCRKHGFC